MQKTVVSWNPQSLADVDAHGPMEVACSGAVLPMQNAVSSLALELQRAHEGMLIPGLLQIRVVLQPSALFVV